MVEVSFNCSIAGQAEGWGSRGAGKRGRRGRDNLQGMRKATGLPCRATASSAGLAFLEGGGGQLFPSREL